MHRHSEEPKARDLLPLDCVNTTGEIIRLRPSASAQDDKKGGTSGSARDDKEGPLRAPLGMNVTMAGHKNASKAEAFLYLLYHAGALLA